MDYIETYVREIIAKLTKTDICEVTPEKKLFQDLHMDSLRAAELLSRISQKFDVFIPDSKLKEITTVSDVISLLRDVSGK